MHTAKSLFAECQKKTLGKDVFCRVFLFAECIFLALGKHDLCRVPDKIHSAKPPALGKVPVSCSGAYVVNSSTETRCSTFTRNHLVHGVTYGAKTDEQSGIYMTQKYVQ